MQSENQRRALRPWIVVAGLVGLTLALSCSQDPIKVRPQNISCSRLYQEPGDGGLVPVILLEGDTCPIR
jgi:hypothetical protein